MWGRVLHQSSVGAQPEVALAVVEDAVHGVGDARDERRVACDLYQSAARAEPEALVLGLVDREDVVDDGAAVVVEFGDLVRIRMRVVAYGPASAVAEPHDRIVLLVDGEEEFFDLQFLVEVESLDLADFRMGLRSAQRDAEYTAAYRSHPQGVRRRLAQRVDEPHLLGDAEAVDPPVGIGVVVQPVAVGADPQQVAAACGESVDRVVQQIAVGRGFLVRHGLRRRSFCRRSWGCAIILRPCSHPQAAFVVDVERTHGLRKVVGQVVEGVRSGKATALQPCTG